MDPSSLSSLIPLLQTLLASPSPLTLGASLTAYSEICPDRLDLLHPYFRHICRMLVDVDEWGQVVAVEVLSRYCRAMLEKPDHSGDVQHATSKQKADESDDDFEGLDIDLAMFLDCARPLFQSRNPAVVLAVAKAYYHLAPAGHKHVGQELLVQPILRIAGSHSMEEVSTVAWTVVAAMAEARPVSLEESSLMIVAIQAVLVIYLLGKYRRRSGQSEQAADNDSNDRCLNC